jgi:hypothetical protein
MRKRQGRGKCRSKGGNGPSSAGLGAKVSQSFLQCERRLLAHHVVFAFWRTSAAGRSGHSCWSRSVANDLFRPIRGPRSRRSRPGTTTVPLLRRPHEDHRDVRGVGLPSVSRSQARRFVEEISACLLTPTSDTQTTRFSYGRGHALRLCRSISASCAVDAPQKLDRGISAPPKRPLVGSDLRSSPIETAPAALPIP